MIEINSFASRYPNFFGKYGNIQAWEIIKDLSALLTEIIGRLGDDYNITDDIAVHKSAMIENNVTMKGPLIISENCFIASNVYLRGPVLLDKNVKIGPGSEIKQSIIFSDTAIAHLNYIGDSIVGSHVNFEAGSVAANHYNEREDKTISVLWNGDIISTETVKFGALVGDHSKIGANAVLSPGTLLPALSVVGRLQLIDQLSQHS